MKEHNFLTILADVYLEMNKLRYSSAIRQLKFFLDLFDKNQGDKRFSYENGEFIFNPFIFGKVEPIKQYRVELLLGQLKCFFDMFEKQYQRAPGEVQAKTLTKEHKEYFESIFMLTTIDPIYDIMRKLNHELY